MLVKLSNGLNSCNEWCLLEFQGEILGDLVGNSLGQIVVKDVSKKIIKIGISITVWF